MRIIQILKHPVQRMPAVLSGWYDERIMRGLFWSWYIETAKRVAVEVKRGTILDVGAGAGYLAIFIGIAAPAVYITGIDSSPTMIRRAKKHADELGGGRNVTFCQGEAVRLDFADESFDMVLNTMAVHCLRKPVRMLDEIYRVLKPEGKLWLYDIRGGERDGRVEMFHKVKSLSPWFMRPFITEKSMKDGGYSAAEVEDFFRQSLFGNQKYFEEGMFFRFEAVKH